MSGKALVVDASVARAAGEPSTVRTSPAPECTAALGAMRESSCMVAVSDRLKTEWDRHASGYAKKWLGNMIATKRVKRVAGNWAHLASVLESSSDYPDRTAREVNKDLDVLNAAMQTDRRVLSLDGKQRVLLRKLCDEVPPLKALYWLSPCESGVIDWLRCGAPDDTSRTLSPS